MTNIIDRLDDSKAFHILDAIVCTMEAPSLAPSICPTLQAQLCVIFQVEKYDTGSITGGELARQALHVLAEDPQMMVLIEDLATSQEENRLQKFDIAASFAITAAVLIVLQTHLSYERDSTGRWTFKIEKKAANNPVLKELVRKLLSYLP